MDEQWELCCVGGAVKIDTPEGHAQYRLDEYAREFIDPAIRLDHDQTYQEFIFPRLLQEGWEPFSVAYTVSLAQPWVYFRRKIKP
jgi:hypothetical protein